jgi:hypothetical protein
MTKMKLMKCQWTIIVASLLIFVLAYYGMNILKSDQKFGNFIETLPLLEKYQILKFAIPVLLFGICFFLMLDVKRKMGFQLCLLLILLFTGYIIYLYSVPRKMPCSCGLPFGLTWKAQFWLNVLLLIFCLIGIRTFKNANYKSQTSKIKT